MKRLRGMHGSKRQIIRAGYLLPVALLVVQLFSTFVDMPFASAEPTLSNFPVTPSYHSPGPMASAGGSLWYLRQYKSDSYGSGYISISKMTTSGVTTDYPIGLPTGAISFVTEKLLTGPDGNVWFLGKTDTNKLYLGNLDVSTESISFHYLGGGSGCSLSTVTSGPDGFYFACHSSGTGITVRHTPNYCNRGSRSELRRLQYGYEYGCWFRQQAIYLEWSVH